MSYLTQEYFHSTLSGCVQNFRPLSHFGTKEAAFEACLRKWIDYRKQCYRGNVSVVAPWEISVKINIQEDDLLRVNADWFSPNLLGITRGLREHYRIAGCTDLSNQLTDILSDPPRRIARKDPETLWTLSGTRLEQFLCDQKIKVISYPNAVEGIKGEESICVIDPQVIHYVSATKMDIDALHEAAERRRCSFARSIDLSN